MYGIEIRQIAPSPKDRNSDRQDQRHFSQVFVLPYVQKFAPKLWDTLSVLTRAQILRE